MAQTAEVFEGSTFTLASLPGVETFEEASIALRLPIFHEGPCTIVCSLKRLPKHISIEVTELVICRCGSVEPLGDAATAQANLTLFSAVHASCGTPTL